MVIQMDRIDLTNVSESLRDIAGEATAASAREPDAKDRIAAIACANGLAQVFIDIAISLRDIAQSQADLVAIANADMAQFINDTIQKEVDERVQTANTKRRPIGQAPQSDT